MWIQISQIWSRSKIHIVWNFGRGDGFDDLKSPQGECKLFLRRFIKGKIKGVIFTITKTLGVDGQIVVKFWTKMQGGLLKYTGSIFFRMKLLKGLNFYR